MKLLKAFYITTCIVNVLNLIDLNCILKRIIKQYNLHRIQEISLLEKIISIIHFLFLAFTPILHIALLIVGFRSIYTEEGKEDFLEKSLENYE